MADDSEMSEWWEAKPDNRSTAVPCCVSSNSWFVIPNPGNGSLAVRAWVSAKCQFRTSMAEMSIFGHPLAENGSSAVRRHLTRKCHNWPSKAENGSQRSISNSADRPTERLISSWLIFFVHRSISLLFEFGCSETPPIDQTTLLVSAL